MFRSWGKMVERCPSCGIALERREQGYQVGAYLVNIVVAELVFVTGLVAVLVTTWPDPPWSWLMYGGAALMVILPVLFYPFSKTLFLGFDLLLHPPNPDDFTGPPTPAGDPAPPTSRRGRGG